MTLTPRVWTSGYLVQAADLIDMETRLGAYADSPPPLGSRLLQKLKNEQENACIMIVGDSTSNWSASADDTKWPVRFLTRLAAKFPRWTIKHKQWNGSFYQLTTTVQTGTNGLTLFVYNNSWGNTGPRWHQTQPEQMWFEPIDPGVLGGTPDVSAVDQLIINHGHNGGSGFPTPSGFYAELSALVEYVALVHSGAEIVLFAQNPRISGTDYQKTNMLETQRYAHLKGYGFFNGWQVISDASPGGVAVVDPNAGALILADGIHPNAAGYDVLAAALYARYRDSNVWTRSQQASSLALPVSTAFITNGSLATFAAGSAPNGWTGSNATFSANATNFETNARSVRMQTTATGSASYMAQNLTNTALLKNKRVTVAMRVRIPSAVTSAHAGVVSIVETGGTLAGETQSVHADPVQGGRDGFMWVVASRHIGSGATGVAVRVYANTTTTDATAQGDVSVDRVVVTRDRFPHDLI